MLGWIERNYGCVAEYNRCREEAEQYEAEKEYERQQLYTKNEDKMNEAMANPNVKVRYYADDCVGCLNYEAIGPTHGDGYGIDDVEHGICHSPNESRQTCQYKKVGLKNCEDMENACEKICWQCGFDHIPCDTCPVKFTKERNIEEEKKYE